MIAYFIRLYNHEIVVIKVSSKCDLWCHISWHVRQVSWIKKKIYEINNSLNFNEANYNELSGIAFQKIISLHQL